VSTTTIVLVVVLVLPSRFLLLILILISPLADRPLAPAPGFHTEPGEDGVPAARSSAACPDFVAPPLAAGARPGKTPHLVLTVCPGAVIFNSTAGVSVFQAAGISINSERAFFHIPDCPRDRTADYGYQPRV